MLVIRHAESRRVEFFPPHVMFVELRLLTLTTLRSVSCRLVLQSIKIRVMSHVKSLLQGEISMWGLPVQ